MDILLKNGDLCFRNGDIVLKNSVRQKINIRLKWFVQEWRWNDEVGLPYFEHIFTKNPDINQIIELIEDEIFNVEEVIEVNDVTVSIDKFNRKVIISYEAVTDREIYREEVGIYG